MRLIVDSHASVWCPRRGAEVGVDVCFACPHLRQVADGGSVVVCKPSGVLARLEDAFVAGQSA